MDAWPMPDRKSTRLNSSHVEISYAVFCLKKKKQSYSRIVPSQQEAFPDMHANTSFQFAESPPYFVQFDVFTPYSHILSPLFFFFNDTATTEIYTLSLHDALPICSADGGRGVSGFVCRIRRGGHRGR